MTVTRKNRSSLRSLGRLAAAVAVSLCLLLGLAGEASARVVPPVAVTVAATGPLVVGQEVTVVVVLQAGDLAGVGFDLPVPRGWTLKSGQTSWFGNLRAGAPLRFEARVVPTAADREPLKGLLRVPGWEDTEWPLHTQGGVR